MSAGGSGNRTVTVTEVGHYLRTGDKVKISGSTTAIFNGIYSITVASTSTYTYTLPENTAVTSPAGDLRAMPVSSVWLATSNAVSMDTSPKGNNAIIEVSAIAIGAISSVEVYDFGAGYSSTPILSTTSGDANAELTAGLGAYATYPGYYTDTKGLLSGVPKIQDNKYYQTFSYVLKTDFDVNDYRNAVRQLTHPSGLIMFGELAIRSAASVVMFDQGRSGNIDSLGTIVQTGPDNEGRKYHNITLFGNTTVANVQFQSYGSNNRMEIYTANHPWQAMNARLETWDEVELQLENYVEISSISRTNSTMYVVTETLHGLETGDTVEFSGDESTQQFNSNYTVTSAPTTNTYTITPSPDHGTDVSQSMYDGFLYVQLEDQTTGNNIIMETASGGGDLMMEVEGYLKSKVIAYSDVFRADATNWDSPFSGGVLNEDGTTILLERGGAYLYPSIQFPEAETGVISIDMSFNSDILLEDDNGAYGYGYLLDETSAGQGNGPQRFISLEEDTQGPDHQYESIPIVDTHVLQIWDDSTRKHLLAEDGLDRFITEDGGLLTLDTIEISYENHIHFAPSYIIYNAITTEDGSYIIDEGSAGSTNTYFIVEDEYGLNNNDAFEVIFNLVESVGWHLRGEDDSHIRHEDGTRMLLEFGSVKAPLVELETEHYDTMGYHLRTEDESHLIHEDTTRALIEEGPVKAGNHIENIEFNLVDYGGLINLLAMEDGVRVLNEDGSRFKSENEIAANNFYSEHKIIQYDTQGYHIRCENDDHIIWEHATEGSEFDNSISRMISEEDHVKSSTRQITMDLGGEILAFEDSSGYFITEGATPNRIMVTPAVPGIKSGQSSYMAPTLMTGAIAIAANSVTAEGSGTSFTTQFSVGDVFQTSDENVILEASEDTVILETLEIIAHEDVTVAEVQNHVLNGIEGYIINTFKWYIGHEDSAESAHEFTPNVIGSYVVNQDDEHYNMLDESSDYGKYVGFEDDSGVLKIELSEFSSGVAILLETGDKMVYTEKGEFKVGAITDDDTLTVTRKHWEGTDAVPFWKQTTEVETAAVVMYK
jgi:hypothetical protein